MIKKSLLYCSFALFLSACVSTTTIQPTDDAPVKGNKKEAALLNVQLGMSYLQKQQMVIAKLKLLKAKKLDDNLPEVHVALGRYYLKVNELINAKNAFLRALSIDKSAVLTNEAYAEYLCETSQASQAEFYFNRAATNPENINVGATYNAAGECAFKGGMVSRARADFNRAIVQNPKLAMPYLRLAQLEYQVKQYYSARTYLSKFKMLSKMNKDALKLDIKLAEHFEEYNKAASLKLKLNSIYSQ